MTTRTESAPATGGPHPGAVGLVSLALLIASLVAMAALSGGEKTRLALACLVHSGANVLLLDEPTNNLDPASRDEVLRAVSAYPGAIVMVTHDDGAVAALQPHRVLLLPDGAEDMWTPDYEDLISLA